jgi:hypothetical protein
MELDVGQPCRGGAGVPDAGSAQRGEVAEEGGIVNAAAVVEGAGAVLRSGRVGRRADS